MANTHKVVKYDGSTTRLDQTQVGKASNPTRAQKRAAALRAARPLGSSDSYSVKLNNPQ